MSPPIPTSSAQPCPAAKNILEKSDWIPFREGLRPTQSLLILGRATLSAVDAENPASFSRKVAQGIVRNCRGHECILVTDDRAIAPVVRHGKCDAGVDAVNPGTDLLLVFYDADRHYTARHCSIKARTGGSCGRGSCWQVGPAYNTPSAPVGQYETLFDLRPVCAAVNSNAMNKGLHLPRNKRYYTNTRSAL